MERNKSKRCYDVAIIGGGPAGSSCAINLANRGIKNVIILESGSYEKFRIGESIPPESRTIFQQMGILETFLKEQHNPCYGSVSFWGDKRRGYNDSILSPYGHGWHLDRRRFNQFLAKQAEKSGATVKTNARFHSAQKLDDETFELTYSVNKQYKDKLCASIVVDATGSKAIFALQQGSKKVNTTPLICLAARFTSENITHPLFKLIHLEAVEYGWWYTAPLSEKSLLVTLYSDKETIKNKKLNQSENWMRCLESTPNTSKQISGLTMVDKIPKGFFALSYCLDRITGQNWIAIGDAASSYDPILSQGIIKSMSNAHYAANIIADKLSDPSVELNVFEKDVVSRYSDYLEMRKYYYRLESRWPESRFWKKYQGEKILI